jgi:hypothetical protein
MAASPGRLPPLTTMGMRAASSVESVEATPEATDAGARAAATAGAHARYGSADETSMAVAAEVRAPASATESDDPWRRRRHASDGLLRSNTTGVLLGATESVSTPVPAAEAAGGSGRSHARFASSGVGVGLGGGGSSTGGSGGGASVLDSVRSILHLPRTWSRSGATPTMTLPADDETETEPLKAPVDRVRPTSLSLCLSLSLFSTYTCQRRW